jgi:hypothetical protein
MPRKKSKGRMYFDMDVQDAIVKYNGSTCDNERNVIYRDEIHYAFDKLAENIINTFKFTYFDYGFEDVKNEVVSFLVMNMHKYDHTKGSKAFSYFSIVAKNYLILNNTNNYKKMKIHDDVSVLNHRKDETVKTEHEDLIKQLTIYFDNNIPKMFKKKRDITIAYAVVELMHRIEEIENFNKKSLYLLIREMTGVNTNNITKIVNEMKRHYNKLSNEYFRNGCINLQKTGNKFF